MQLRDAPYYRAWQRRYAPLIADDYWNLSAEFSPGYFEKLRRELEENGYKITISDYESEMWFSPPIGYFFVDDLLKGESFVFLVM